MSEDDVDVVVYDLVAVTAVDLAVVVAVDEAVVAVATFAALDSPYTDWGWAMGTQSEGC